MNAPPGLRRWVNVALRGAHLCAVIALGAALLGAPLAAGAAALALALSGFAMLLIDSLSHPAHLREVAGVAVLVKLLLVAWLAVDAAARLPLFWLLVAGSVLFAHAPARVRHAIVLGRRRG